MKPSIANGVAMFRRSEQSIHEFVEQYELERALTKEAARQYRYAAKSITDWAGGFCAVEALEPDLFNRWLRDLQEGNLSAATIANRRRHLLALWRAAADTGKCEQPPRRLRPMKVPYVPPRAWTVDEVRAILAVCRGLRRTRQGKMQRDVFWSLAVRLAWESALRLTDLLRLRVEDVRPDGLVVMGQSKTNRPVAFRLSQQTLDALKASLEGDTRKLVLPWPSSRESFRRQFANVVRKSGVRKGTWKWLRRSSATDVEKACPGAGASHLGHAHGSVIAARHYLDPYIIGAPTVCPTALD